MLEIRFLNVDQGDSLVLEWIDDGTRKVGLIDCNIDSSKNNRTLEFIIESGYNRIEFIILSHPHFDHFSGIRSLLEYVEEMKFHVELFLTTAYVTPEFLRVATQTVYAERELYNMFKCVDRLKKNKLISKVVHLSNDTRELELNQEIRIKTLAPSTNHIDKYLTKSKMFAFEEDGHNNPYANWLSTVLKIYNKNWYVLLTSDSDKSVLKHLGIKEPHQFKETMVLCQSSHHGSYANHSPSFYKLRSRSSNTPVVISVGKNRYGHPSSKTIESFTQLKFKVYSTNQVGCLKSARFGTSDNQISNLLDVVSKLIHQRLPFNNFSGDKAFRITDNQIEEIL